MNKVISLAFLMLLCMFAQSQQGPNVKSMFGLIPGIPATCEQATAVCEHTPAGYSQSKIVQNLFRELDVLSPWTGDMPVNTVRTVRGHESAAEAVKKIEALSKEFVKEWDAKLTAINTESHQAVVTAAGTAKPATQEEAAHFQKVAAPIQVKTWNKYLPELKRIYDKYYSQTMLLLEDVSSLAGTSTEKETQEMMNFRSDVRTKTVTAVRTYLDKSSALSATLANTWQRMKNLAN